MNSGSARLPGDNHGKVDVEDIISLSGSLSNFLNELVKCKHSPTRGGTLEPIRNAIVALSELLDDELQDEELKLAEEREVHDKFEKRFDQVGRDHEVARKLASESDRTLLDRLGDLKVGNPTVAVLPGEFPSLESARKTSNGGPSGSKASRRRKQKGGLPK